ncbi:MAG TPA: tyrosine-type recombinase/integrase [Mobilitalea sp.]|nr:tyrosine-type recombinase/integrase [Mobilitalea sp.]
MDRATKIGKRDFALSLIAIRLGLRGSDIRNLQLSDIDWEKHVISICQIKTKEIQVLPLPDDVGWAIIDYIQNARPNTDYKNLFVRMTPPFSPYSNYGFQSMIDKYCYAAGINHENMKSGLHSFRNQN